MSIWVTVSGEKSRIIRTRWSSRIRGSGTFSRLAQSIALLLLLAPIALAPSPASGQSLAELWEGRAAWELAGENVGADFTFHCLSIWPHDGRLLGYYIANYTNAAGRNRMGSGRARSDDGMKWTDEDGPS